MPQRYSSKAQEAHYQPRRIRVLVDEFGSDGGRLWRTVYFVGIQNMVSREVEDWLLWPRYNRHNDVPIWSSTLDPPGNWGGRQLQRDADTKADAIKWAKIEAVDLELPFDLQSDVMDFYDAVGGEVVKCLVCGKTWPSLWSYRVKHRGHYLADARVCGTCRGLVEQGKGVLQGRKHYALHPALAPGRQGLHDTPLVDVLDNDGNVIGKRYGESPTTDEDLLAVILGLTNSKVEGTTYPYAPGIEGNIMLEGQGYEKPHLVSFTRQQAEWVQRLIDLHAKHVRTAFLAGKHQGSSLVKMLANAEIHPDDFADLRSKATNKKER